MTTRKSLVYGFVCGFGVASAGAYYFAIRPMSLAAELSAQAGFMLLRASIAEKT